MTAPRGSGGAGASEAEAEAVAIHLGFRAYERACRDMRHPVKLTPEEVWSGLGSYQIRHRTEARLILDAAAAARPAPAGEASEVERLREALIKTGNNIGAWLSEGVSTDFLMHVPNEAQLKINDLRTQIAAAEAENARLRTMLAASREVLRQVESEGRTMAGASCCPVCHGLMRWGEFSFPKPPIGHAPDCALAALLTPTAERDRHDGP